MFERVVVKLTVVIHILRLKIERVWKLRFEQLREEALRQFVIIGGYIQANDLDTFVRQRVGAEYVDFSFF